MYGLRTESEHCPDGVTLGADSIFRSRSAKRHKLRLETADLRAPYVLAFVNATDDRKLAEFLSRNGFLDSGLSECPATDLHRQQIVMAHLLERAGSNDPQQIAEAINTTTKLEGAWMRALKGLLKADPDDPEQLAEYHMKIVELGAPPTFTAMDDRGMVFFLCDNLAALMRAEVRLVADRGATFSRCGHCHDGILTGAATGRRGHSRYCSNRCRTAALRARQAAT